MTPTTRPLLVLAAVLAGCGSGDSDRFRLVPQTAEHPSAAGLAPVNGGPWVVYFAAEALEGPGTDLNGDGDAADTVAVVIDVLSRTEVVLGVAAVEAAVVENEIYLVVDEAAELPTGTPLDPSVPPFRLAHWSRAADVVTRFDDFGNEPGPRLFVNDLRLYYASGATPSGTDATSIRCVEPAAPTAPIAVSTDGAGSVGAVPVGVRDGLLVARLPETNAASAAGDWPDGDLNGDGDALDTVLGLLDATDLTAPLAIVGVALPATPVFDARLAEDGRWLVGFLADEVGEGVDLNDPGPLGAAWLPEACPLLAADGVVPGQAVLHALRFDGLTGAPRNTGLVGTGRVVALTDVVATLSPEASAGCDLNNDGDVLDTVARWVEVVDAPAPLLPPGLTSELHAVDLGAGPSQGLAGLGERLVLVVDEAQDGRDHDGKGADHDLVASRDPLDSLESGFVFEHRSGVADFDEAAEAFVTREPFVGVSWMADEAVGIRLGVAYQEEVPGEVLNRNDFCNDVPKDGDVTDTVAAWPRLRSDSERSLLEPDFPLIFPGVGYAVFANNPGIVIVGAVAFLRVSEAADRTDHNGDGDQADAVLFLSQLSSCLLTDLGTASAVAGPSVATDGTIGAAYLTDETMDGVDRDGDGDALDLVVRYFHF